MATRDIVVVGASAGGIEALATLATKLPRDFPAAILAVIHVAPYKPSMLDEIIGRNSVLKTCLGEQGQRIRKGSLYLAPPDHHMVIQDHHILLTRGPHDNRVRPAVDPLFRSAAMSYGPLAIGVILTGALDDGSAGLAAIKRCGGVAVVQDPEDAAYPDMPLNAIAAVKVDHTVPLARMPGVLRQLTREEVSNGFQPPADLVQEVKMTSRDKVGYPPDAPELEAWGKQVSMSCPDCGGPLRERLDGQVRRYRCHVGHTFAAKSLMVEQSERVETALWTAVRTLEERARMLGTMARDEEKRGRKRTAKSFTERADEAREQAQSIRSLLSEYREPAE